LPRGLGTVGLLLAPLRRQALVDLGDELRQRGEVADDVRLLGVLTQRRQTVGDLLRGDLRGVQALVQQRRRGVQLVVLAGEVLQRLLGRGVGVGAHLAFAPVLTHEDSSLLVDAAEGGGGAVVAHGRRGFRGRGRAGAGGSQASQGCRRGRRGARGVVVVTHTREV